ncbi:MAG TPA: nucleotidyltransferase [Lachnospiraceae bacterium]|nr:nucleotidyltransferase [Lachnospiraceae bacterium]HAL31331.1 nucleotidyltransferase [Lachnospiraceae bacterium]
MKEKKDVTLLIMAAGMGSRYGGMKQIDHVDEEGHKIIDFSIYDAKTAGFTKVVFVIKKENLGIFRREIGDAVSKYIDVEYAFQELSDIPDSFNVPEGREKPWGTAHAVLSARNEIHEPFAVINADDFYGRDAFKKAYEFLAQTDDGHYAMIAYELKNTLTENGTVSRGICDVSDDGLLTSVTERTKIRKAGEEAEYTEDDGNTWSHLPGNAATSMNFWCFAEDFMGRIGTHFERFLKEEVAENPLKAECYLPTVVSALLSEGKCDVQVIKTSDKWHGVTYKEDKPALTEAIREMKRDGLYPQSLW